MVFEDVTLLIVPGLRGDVPEHWQSHLQREAPRAITVAPLAIDGMSRQARVANFARTLERADGPVVLVAHSAGCMIVAHWVASGGGDARIVAALLATPADIEADLPPGYPRRDALAANGWLPAPAARLPFRTIVGASRNDPLATYARVEAFAAAWGAQIEDLGAVGHLNPAAGFGPWPQATALLARLIAV